MKRADKEWICGFVTALAEMHRRLIGGNDSTGVCEVARNAGITIASAKAAGSNPFDWKELKRAGVALGGTRGRQRPSGGKP